MRDQHIDNRRAIQWPLTVIVNQVHVKCRMRSLKLSLMSIFDATLSLLFRRVVGLDCRWKGIILHGEEGEPWND